jgi:hypothetical protein
MTRPSLARLALAAGIAMVVCDASAQDGPRKLPDAMHGIWGSSSDSCTNPADDGRVEVRARAVTFFASQCSLTRFSRSEDGTVTGHGRCRGEGETTTERGSLRLRLAGRDRLVIALDGGEGSTYQRCARPLPVR